MKKTLKHLLLLLLIASMLCSLFPAHLVVTAAGTGEEGDSLVVIDDPLTSEASLSRFRGFACTPALKMLDGKPVGITMGNYDDTLGWPYMIFGESNWADYILEFTTHDLTRVGGIVRSTGAVKNNDGYGGIMVMCDGYLAAHYQKPGENKSVKMTADKTSGNFTATAEMRFRIAVSGASLSFEVTTDPNGASPVTYSMRVDDTSESQKTSGKLGFRSVFRDINGENHEGYFSDLKVTLTGSTADEYRIEQRSDSVTVIDDPLTDANALSLFEGYGCTPALKVIDGAPVGVTMDGATSAMGYPYLLFGEDYWRDYSLEFDTHGMNRVGAVVRSTGAIAHIDGTGGINVVYEGLQSPAKLYTHYATVDSSGTRKANTITTGDPYSAQFTYNGDMHFSVTVKGTRLDCTVTYTENGVEQSHSITVFTQGLTKTEGKAALRAVYRQVNGEQSEGYFSNLKVTLHGDTATRYQMEHPSDRTIVIRDDLKTAESLALFEGYGCVPVLKEIGGEVVGVTMGNATDAMGYPYLLFGEEGWQDYSLEFTAYGMNRVGGVVRIGEPLAQTDGYDGIAAMYEGLSNPGKMFSLYSTVKGTTGTSMRLSGYGTPEASFNVNKNYDQAMRFKITVMGELVLCRVTYDGIGNTETHTICVNVAESGKEAGKLALRAVYRQVNGEQANGYFSDLKVTLLGNTATEYKKAHPIEPPVLPGDLDGNSKIENADAVLLVRYLSGWDVGNVTLACADLDSNGKINNRDAISLIRILCEEPASSDIYKRVVLVGIDGAGNFTKDTPTPNIDEIFAGGAFTLNASSTTPSISAQAWTSILHGITPEYHGRTNQNTSVETYPADSVFPSVFRVIREQMPDASLACVSAWTNINYGMIEDGYGVTKINTKGSDLTAVNRAVRLLNEAVENEEEVPTLMFVYLTEPDTTGHDVGWETDAYLKKITYQDTLIRKIYDTYEELGLLDDTLFLLATDHGGLGTTHGGNSEAEMQVMFGAKGKTVPAGGTVGKMDVRDIAAITLHALGLEQPSTWTARIPSGIFAGVGASERPVYVGAESVRNHAHKPTPAIGSAGDITNYVTDKTLTHYLTFDNTVEDRFGNTTSAHNGISYTEGYFGESVSLADGYVSVENFAPGYDSFSVSFWMKTKGVTSDPAIFSNKDWASGRNPGFVLAITNAKILKFNVGDGTNRVDLNSDLPVDYVDGWMHVTAIVDRAAGQLKLSYDFGEFQTVALPDTLIGDSFDAYPVLNIGQDGTGEQTLKLSVSLDEFMIFDGVLDADDLDALARYYGKK